MTDTILNNHAAGGSEHLSVQELPWRQLFERAVSLLIAIVLLRSATHHFTNPYAFLISIYKYELVNPRVGEVVAITLPALQSLVAIGLLSRVAVSASLMLSTTLMTMFTAVQATALAKGLDISCGCFGPVSERQVNFSSVTFVGILTIAAAVALTFHRKHTDDAGQLSS
ncbi:MAG: hypothetical protein Fues2KO_34480 [Fuerstiella sp.]